MTRAKTFRSWQSGVALVAVLWVVAALSILVSGLVETQREEIRIATSARTRQFADAVGQAAIHLAVQGMLAETRPLGRLVRRNFLYEGLEIQVEIQPLSGMVDLNLAPGPLLAELYAIGGGLERSVADRLAAATVASREATPPEAPVRFQAPEDLLSVPGIDYDLYARLAPLVTTESQGTGRVNPLAAIQRVLILLTAGDEALASRLAADRDANLPGIDTTRINGAFIDSSESSRFRFMASVPVPDGSLVLVARDIDTSPATEAMAPWRTLRKYAPLTSLK